MSTQTSATRRKLATTAGAVGAVVLLSGCGGAEADHPQAHIHGMAVDVENNRLYLATHDGLYDMSADPIEMVSPAIDLMGFTATAEPGHFYASGHPGPGVELPNPVGLIESTDGGKSWQPVSRQGESDFHSLTASQGGIIGYDGVLRTSEEGKDWSRVDSRIVPADLSGSPESEVVLATTEQALMRSPDGGANWAAVPGAPLMYLTDFASAGAAAGVTPDGQVHTTDDGGLTWRSAGGIGVEPHAITAALDDAGKLRVWIATAQDIQVSSDAGKTFSRWGAD